MTEVPRSSQRWYCQRPRKKTNRITTAMASRWIATHLGVRKRRITLSTLRRCSGTGVWSQSCGRPNLQAVTVLRAAEPQNRHSPADGRTSKPETVLRTAEPQDLETVLRTAEPQDLETVLRTA